MNRLIYEEIAKKYGTTVDEVKEEMQVALNEVCAACALPSNKSTAATVDEFLDYVREQIQNNIT